MINSIFFMNLMKFCYFWRL